MTSAELNRELGNTDIYLLDQILKERIKPGMKILDAGCGEGRNLTYFMRNGFDVHGVDINPSAIRMLRFVAASMQIPNGKERFQTGSIEELSFPNDEFDWIICSAVLHFTKDETMFFKMVSELYRVLKPGGTLFIRMASDSREIDTKQSDFTFLLNENVLQRVLADYGFTKAEPEKTVIVENLRAMATLVLRKEP